MDIPRFYFTNEFCDFKELLEQHSVERRIFPKGSTIFSSSEKLDFCLYIEKGLSRYSIVHENGGEKTLFFHGEGSLFPTYSSSKRYRIGELSVAITDVEGFVVPQATLKELMGQNPALSERVLEAYLEMFNYLIFESINQIYNNAYIRLCNFFHLYMEYLEGNRENKYRIYFTQEELAKIIGVSRVQISHILKTLREQKIIQNYRNRIEILDEERLQEQCSGETV